MRNWVNASLDLGQQRRRLCQTKGFFERHRCSGEGDTYYNVYDGGKTWSGSGDLRNPTIRRYVGNTPVGKPLLDVDAPKA